MQTEASAQSAIDAATTTIHAKGTATTNASRDTEAATATGGIGGAATGTAVARLRAFMVLPTDRPFWVMILVFVVIFMCLLLQMGCASRSKTHGDSATSMSNSYEDIIARNTREDLQYDGFYNKFEVRVTFLNSEVQAALLQKKGEAFKWNAKQAQSEREKLFQENSNQTKFAMSFFVPSTRLNDLHKASSIWKIYLEAGGQRYEGKVTRRNGKLEDIQTLFNYHTRWSTAYDVVFNVPLSGIEGSGAITFILTSTQGSATLSF